MKYLKDQSYYEDLYDKGTIEECKRALKFKPSKKEVKALGAVDQVVLYCIKGERYSHKEGAINEWIARDQVRDDLLENAEPKDDIFCPACSSKMKFDFKELRLGIEKPDRVMFWYVCPQCDKKRLFYDDGEEWKPKPYLCPKCQSILIEKHGKTKNTISTYLSCPRCKYEDEITFDLNKKSEVEKPDPNFEKDRTKYCMTEEEGKEYISNKFEIDELKKLLEQSKKKVKKRKIKILKVIELQVLLSKSLKKEGYTKFQTSDPEIDRYLVIHFTAYDNQKDRHQYDSRQQLKKLINKALTGTNWHLMSDGINYRLGILSGRLRGEEND